MEDNAKNNRNVFIRGNDSRGDEVISVLSDFGGLNNYCFDGSGKDRVYFINHAGFIDYEEEYRELAKIIMDNYREIKLRELWKDGDVLVNRQDSTKMVLYKFDDDKPADLFNTHLRLNGDMIILHTLEVRDKYRLATPKEILHFHKLLHKCGKDWDADKNLLVDWSWEPEAGELYYSIESTGEVSSTEWTNDGFDINRNLFGNCFRTREEAEAVAEKIKKLLKGGTV